VKILALRIAVYKFLGGIGFDGRGLLAAITQSAQQGDGIARQSAPFKSVEMLFDS
jgi:hypothetical protein